MPGIPEDDEGGKTNNTVDEKNGTLAYSVCLKSLVAPHAQCSITLLPTDVATP